jgi:hypothetical protein
MWECVFKNKGTDYECNSFLYIFLKIFEASLPMQNRIMGRTKKKNTGLH